VWTTAGRAKQAWGVFVNRRSRVRVPSLAPYNQEVMSPGRVAFSVRLLIRLLIQRESFRREKIFKKVIDDLTR